MKRIKAILNVATVLALYSILMVLYAVNRGILKFSSLILRVQRVTMNRYNELTNKIRKATKNATSLND